MVCRLVLTAGVVPVAMQQVSRMLYGSGAWARGLYFAVKAPPVEMILVPLFNRS